MEQEKKNVALLSNITVDLIIAKLRRKYCFYQPEGFDTWVQEVINPASSLYSQNFDAIVVLLDGTEARAWRNAEEGKERLTIWKQAVTALTNQITNIPIFISTVDIRENRIKSFSERKYAREFESIWELFLWNKAEEKRNVYVFDLVDTISEIGRKQFYSDKMWYISSMPYSREGLNAVTTEIDRALQSTFTVRKKIIVLDLDNTVWGGIIGEDGIEGIEISTHKEGQRYYDFQRQLLEMKKRGILLAVNSKNNPEDAQGAINNHPAMLLREDDFVSMKINWQNKAVNIKELETELNLTESGFIFIDDNPVEREIIKGECPEVMVPVFPEDTTELLSFAENIWFDYCRPLRILEEDFEKTQMYQNEVKRKQESESNLNFDDYIARLELKADIHKMRSEEIERVAQLCNKTNQFNLTTKRYSVAEIEHIAANDNNAIYVTYCSDKYGDSGLISVLIMMNDGDEARIDTFLMSCRVMGRKLEDVILNEIALKYTEKREIIGEFISTAKNIPVKDLYDRLGFKLFLNNEEHKMYSLDTAGYKKKKFESYKQISFEE